MTPAEIVERARYKTGCTISEVSDDLVFADLNDLYFQLWEEMIQIDQNKWLTERKEDLVQWVSTYVLKPATPWSPLQKDRWWIFKPNMVLVSFTDWTQTQAKLIDMNQLQTSPEILQNWTFQWYTIGEDSITIYPTPKVTVPSGLKVIAHNTPYKLTSTMGEGEIVIPKEYRELLLLWLIPRLYEYRQAYDLVWVSEQRYMMKKAEIFKNIKQRATRPMQSFASNRNFRTS